MDEIKRKLIERERGRAAVALTEYLYCHVAPYVPAQGEDVVPIEIFNCGLDLEKFCQEREILPRALLWLLGKLRSEGLLEPGVVPVTLSRHGVERYCRD
jgi:hypothetical protein